jgi:regulatory protein
MRIRRLGLDELMEYAVKALAARAFSAGELRQKLMMRAERASDVDAAISRLKEHGYLDDKQYAESYAAARLDSRGFGKARVIRDLRQRRVAPKTAEQAVAKAYKGADEVRLIEEFIRRKYRGAAPEEFLKDPKSLASAYRRLIYAGFSTGDVIRVLKRFAADPELLDQFEPPQQDEEQGS